MIDLLKDSLAINQKISKCINANQWEEVEKLQQQMQTLLLQLKDMETPSNNTDIETINTITQEIQKLTQEHLEAGKARKEQLYLEIKKNNKSKKMNNAYETNKFS